MSDSSLSFSLLTLFTSPERAVSIHGDLMEEAQTRGRLWFWSEVIRTTGALCLQGFARSPLAILALVLSGGASWFLMTLLMIAGETAVEFGFRSLGILINIPLLPVFLLGALLAGLVLGRAAPIRGIYASVGLAFVSVPVLVLLHIQWITLLVASLLLGSAVSRHRAAARAN